MPVHFCRALTTYRCLRAQSVRSWSGLVLLLPSDDLSPNKLSTLSREEIRIMVLDRENLRRYLHEKQGLERMALP